jgi:hypothetical protein
MDTARTRRLIRALDIVAQGEPGATAPMTERDRRVAACALRWALGLSGCGTIPLWFHESLCDALKTLEGK